jgi:FKBP-type peptidyl-prolyl cis-trans isomerase SlyD
MPTSTPSVSSPTSKIAAGKVVDLQYSLKNSKGEVLDQADAADPFSYLHGADQIVPGLETALEGLKVGDKKDVTVPPAQGYGERIEDLRLSVARTQLPADLDLQPGMAFEADAGNNGGMTFVVEAIKGDQIQLDGNHPLAGEILHFSVEVLNVRDATEEEQEHGHAHDGDGHHHH